MELPSLNRIVPRHHLVEGVHLGNSIIQKVGKTEIPHGAQLLHDQTPSEVTPIKGCHGRAPVFVVEKDINSTHEIVVGIRCNRCEIGGIIGVDLRLPLGDLPRPPETQLRCGQNVCDLVSDRR
jgi:hypothetical protein